ncbi:tripartite tricarboxylate transporter TctB family protein [Roseibaca sp. V10]|uniref:Tripartite tricarboxylate transporter TctB family protein n=1 Tax=Roseinatronobacter domitianus TaxID=2940293 RepID=A0ABT0M279_9RHOB|nr:tripartite tricarboxylate transporter TctB family protein [Roseibaca domitiana]MCL1628971.1 tripartite tricarboxylate transporter TctB family protein [Roseibaca domitiana]
MTKDHNGKESAAPAAGFLRASLNVPTALADIAVCLALGALGLWFVVNAAGMPAGRTMIGIGTFPMIVGVILVALCLVQIGLSLRNFRNAGTISFHRPLAVPIGMGLMLLFPFAMDSFGYFQTAALWVPAFAWVAGVAELPTILTLTAVILGLAYFLFQMLLGTPLP